jgi:hypothetical protein
MNYFVGALGLLVFLGALMHLSGMGWIDIMCAVLMSLGFATAVTCGWPSRKSKGEEEKEE